MIAIRALSAAVVFAAITTLWPASARAATDLCAGTLTPLSATACKPDAQGNLTIGKAGCATVYVDKAFIADNAFGTITIKVGGALCVRDSDVTAMPASELAFQAGAIEVLGTFAIGSSTTPIGTTKPADHVTMTFLGRPARTQLIRDRRLRLHPLSLSRAQKMAEGPCPDSQFSKGIEVCKGGTLQLFGAKGVPGTNRVSWTYLSKPAGDPAKFGAQDQNMAPTGIQAPVTEPNAQTITVADDTSSDWQIGDWIAVATTSFSPIETEFVKISNISGKTITLEQPLKYYHFGSIAPDNTKSDPSCKDASDSKGVALLPASFCEGASQNYGVDERAEVGLISRNVTLTSDADTKSDRMHWGGEIKLREGYAEASIQGVELAKFGKDQLGSYPIHFHMDGAITQPTLVNANSIHHSYNKCITVHMTSNVTIQNNVCARIVGHIFYEELGSETNVSFLNNLGLGAMSNNFDIAATDNTPAHSRPNLIAGWWWIGDNMTNGSSATDSISYDGFNIPNTDDSANPVHGSCQVKDPNGRGGLTNPNRNPNTPPSPAPPCKSNELYTEPASGFWIANPGTILQGNSIGGCQGVGRGYWYVTPENRGLEFTQVSFLNNRVHSCYDGLYDENEFTVQSAQTLNPRQGNVSGGQPLIATFDGLTATRIRDRGVWLRSAWFLLKNSRFATDRDAVTLLTSGGIDGNGPGVWEMLESSVVVGLSTNNVDRFGPCPYDTAGAPAGTQPGGFTGWDGFNFGCVDRTPGAKDEMGKGYPDYRWNSAGYMIYDGPVRISNDRFVAFHVKPAFDAADQKFLTAFNKSHPFPNTSDPYLYEGDAVFGWFQSNQSAYPNATVSDLLHFDDVDLRHQIYTQAVNLGTFNDSDKNTAIIDRDGSLSGFKVVGPDGSNLTSDTHPISLNNLEINAARLPSTLMPPSVPDESSVDECQAEGLQDAKFEKRPTSLMSPADIGTLEFGALYPIEVDSADNVIDRHDQLLTFVKDSTDYNQHTTMTLHGRDGRGIWEPRVANGYGYTVTAAAAKLNVGTRGAPAGIPKVIDVGVADIVNAD
ncbi:MAG TPA: hypothetical protein VJN94_13380, partial [Candidatus Binataceae bacterium]|nr:hypothetical protein [Candidatus Binataceae bacterium]